MNLQVAAIIAIAVGALALGIGIIIGHFAIKKTDSVNKYERLTRQADEQTYTTFIDSIQAQNIEENLK